MNAFDRRSLFKLVGLGATAVAVPSLMSACSTGSVGDAGNLGKDLVPWPNYHPLAGPAADAPGDASGLQPLFKSYPQKLTQSVNDKVGDGSDVSAVILTYGNPPTPAEQNKLWQELNKALGVNLKLTVVPAADWGAKIATVTAGGDLPDIMMSNDIPRMAEFVQAQCADLSEFLSGDAVKAYPNLANLPSVTWQRMGRIGGKIYGIPVPRPVAGSGLIINRTAFDAVGAPEKFTRDEFLAALKAVSGNGKWGAGTASEELIAYGASYYYAMSESAPNGWKVDGGKFTPTLAAPEFKQALETFRKAVEQGSYHPDSLSIKSSDQTANWLNGTIAAKFLGFGGVNLDTATRIGNRFKWEFAFPYGNGKAWQSGGIFGFTVFKKAPADRIKLLLRVVNYLAAPFGTKEYELTHYGIEGVHFTRDAAIGIKPTELALTKEKPLDLSVRYIADGPWPIFIPGFPDQAQNLYDYTKATLPTSLPDPSIGLRSASLGKNIGTLNKIVGDGIGAVAFGRKSLSEWDTVVSEWNKAGGATAAEELAAEYAAAQAK
ncbi:MAG TPA: extracellular solute-binding protein [Candidatus Limnocylindrales bacterium]